MAKQKIHSTTQDFTQIVDIQNDVVFFKDRTACMLMEVSSVNFFLLSQDEQNARIYGYMALLNSLSFTIQIIIVSRKIDMSAYLSLLDQKIISVKNPKISDHLKAYKDFIGDLVKEEGLLDKKLYIVIPFTPLEMGPVPAKTKASYNEQVRTSLMSKLDNIMVQVERMGLSARILETQELAKLYYELFNQDFVTMDFDSSDPKNIVL